PPRSTAGRRGGLGLAGADFRDHRVTRAAIDPGANAALASAADHRIALPIAPADTPVGGGRPVGDADGSGDWPAFFRRGTLAAPVTPELRPVFAIGVAGAPGRDGWVRDLTARRVGTFRPPPAGALRGRPIRGQTAAHVRVGVGAFPLARPRALAAAGRG